MKDKKYYILGFIVILLTLSLYGLYWQNQKINELTTDKTELIEENEKFDLWRRRSSALSMEYKDRLEDLWEHIEDPAEIDYELPYNTNECGLEESNNEDCTLFSEEQYLINNCIPFNYEIIVLSGPNSSCIEKYRTIFRNWNPDAEKSDISHPVRER